MPPSPVAPADLCAVVVTYHPDGSAYDCLRAIRAEAAHLVIVANSAEAQVRELRSAAVTVVENPANVGVAAALNQGVRAARDRGYRWILFLDQDTKVLPGAIAELAGILNDCRAEFGDRLGLLGTNFFHVLADGSVAEAGVPCVPGRRWIERDMVITSGTVLGLEAFGAIGPFAEEYFIDHVDHEYCLRARRRGFAIVRTVQPLVVHRLGMSRLRSAVVLPGIRRILHNYSPLRRYYQARNLRLLAREYGAEFRPFVARLQKLARREAVRALKYEPQRLRKLAAVLLARSHARRGITGPYRGRLLRPPAEHPDPAPVVRPTTCS
jgi:rhamnosyltransferase